MTQSPQKRRIFISNSNKIRIAEEATSKTENYRNTARKYQITLSQVQNYVRNLDKLKQKPSKKSTHSGKVPVECGTDVEAIILDFNAAGHNISTMRLAASILSSNASFLLNSKEQKSSQLERVRQWVL
jgi:transposase-like protein